MAKKLESSFKNMVIVLFLITLIASVAVGMVYELTKVPIALVKQNKELKAIKAVVPDFDNSPALEMYSQTIGKDTVKLYPAKKNGELVGTAVKIFANNGFSGKFWIMVGFKPNGSIYNYSILEHKETPGLGSRMDIWFTEEGKSSIIGMNPQTNNIAVSKEGGDVDAITAATITSVAFLDAVKVAYKVYSKNMK